MPKSKTAASAGSSRSLRRSATAPPKPSSLQPGVADPGDEDPLGSLLGHGEHLHLGGEEEEEPAGLAQELLAGHAVDGDAQVHACRRSRRRSARSSPCGRRACGPAGRPRGRAAAARCRRAGNDALDLDLGLAGAGVAHGRRRRRRLGGHRVAQGRRGRAARTTSSGVVAAARSIISRTAGSCRRDRRALAVAQRVHVQQQRLLDLGGVEQAAAALRRDLRVVGQHDRGAEQDVVGCGVASTGHVLTLAGGRPRAARRSARPRRRSSGWVESSEWRSAPRAVEAGAAPRCGSRPAGARGSPTSSRAHAQPHGSPTASVLLAAGPASASALRPRPGGARPRAQEAHLGAHVTAASSTHSSTRWSKVAAFPAA